MGQKDQPPAERFADLRQNFSDVQLPFDPADDLIFVFKSIDSELANEQLTLTLMRNIMQANICSTSYTDDRHDPRTGKSAIRGKRMIVVISATSTLPASIPELKPEIVPLPDLNALRHIAMDVLEPAWQDYRDSKGKLGYKPLEKPEANKVVNSLCGMTAQDAEEALTLSMVKHPLLDNLDDFINTIEHEKARCIASIPGLSYVPREQIVGEMPPGYETLIQRMSDYIDEDGTCHLRGVSMGGPPGVAKTVTAKFIARYLNRIGLILDIGATKGSLVGQSEQNIRRALQIADALHAVLILDDVDKGGLNKGRDYGGDGGTTGNMIQAMLTTMSDPACNIVFIFTFNRVPDLPELLRLGRVDLRLYVEEPKTKATRKAILNFGFRQIGMGIDDETFIPKLVDASLGMTGAEIIHGLIKPAHLRASRLKQPAISGEYMLALTHGFTPMLQQAKYVADLAQLREDCSQFLKIGNIPDTEDPEAEIAIEKAPQTGRGKRAVSN